MLAMRSKPRLVAGTLVGQKVCVIEVVIVLPDPFEPSTQFNDPLVQLIPSLGFGWLEAGKHDDLSKSLIVGRNDGSVKPFSLLSDKGDDLHGSLLQRGLGNEIGHSHNPRITIIRTLIRL